MAECVFTKRDGDKCAAQAMRDSLLCYQHNPDVADERHRSHVKGGRTGGRGRPKGGSELAWVKARLKEVTEGVLEGTIDTRKGAVVAQLLTAYRGAVETEMRVFEQEELVQRLDQVEAQTSLRTTHGFG